MRITRTSYQAKDSAKMTKVEPRQVPTKPNLNLAKHMAARTAS